jgi:hypothetical protein
MRVYACVIEQVEEEEECEEVSGRRGRVRSEELLCYQEYLPTVLRGLLCCLEMPCFQGSPPSTYHKHLQLPPAC